MAELPTRKFIPKSVKKLEKNYFLKHVLTDRESAIKFAEIERKLKRSVVVYEVGPEQAWGVFVKK